MEQIDKQGFSTLEMLVAISIFSLTFTAIVMLSFGSQNIISDSTTSLEALALAEKNLEYQGSLASKDFRLANGSEATTTSIYQAYTEAHTIDFFQKKITSTVSYKTYGGAQHQTSLSRVVADFMDSSNRDTCDSFLTGDWTNAGIKNSIADFASLVFDPLSSYSISDIDAYLGKLYITADNTSAKDKESVFIFNISDPSNPSLISKIDNNPAVMDGPSAITVGKTASTTWAFLTNGHPANYTTCKPGPSCSEFQAIDASNAASPSLKASFTIPTSTTPFISGSFHTNSIFYRGNFVYLGLSETSTGPEFNIIDVSSPNNPKWVGGYKIGDSITDIYVKGDYAYVSHKATDSVIKEQLAVLDIKDPQSPVRVAGYFYNGGILNSGKSLQAIGDILYFGRLASKTSGTSKDTIPEFYYFDISDPTHLDSNLIASTTLVSPESLNDLLVRDNYAFFLETHKLEIWNTGDSATTSLLYSLTLPASGGATTPSMDCEGNYIFIGSNDTSNKGNLYVITAK